MKQKLCMALVIFPPVLYFVTIAMYWLGMPITLLNSFISLGISSYLANKQSKPTSKSKLLGSVLAISFLILVYVAVMGFLHSLINDFSWDGRQYHAEAISQLKQGFNPIYQRLLPDQWGYGDASVWINTLPKFSWVIGATFYYIFNDISSSKLLLTYYLVPTFYYLAIVLRGFFGKNEEILIAGALVLNPVVLSQIYTNYVDGLGYILLLIYFAMFIDLSGKNRYWLISGLYL